MMSEGKKKIIIVDDDPTMIELIKRGLQTEYQVITAENGLQAIKKIISENPDLVIMDVLMPELSGYKAIAELKNLKSDIRNVPIIMISGVASTKEFFKDIEIQAFLNKPFEIKDLIKEVKTALGS